MTSLVIVSAVRTPIGKFGGALADIPATDLGALVMQEALYRAKLAPDAIDEVIFGNVLQGGLGQNPARQAQLKAHIPQTAVSTSINMVCGSGLQSVILAGQSILAGSADIVMAGGMENMSAAPYLLDKARFGYRMGNQTMVDSMINDGLFCAINHYHMGITAENVADRYGISRGEQDEVALISQQRAAQAIASGAFDAEIVPVPVVVKRTETLFAQDEFVRPETTMASLGKLKPAFTAQGSVTAGNASGINDGAAALILMTEEKAAMLGLKPLARIISHGVAGVDPACMGMGPVPATRLALQRAGMKVADLDLIEANEAFAAQYAAVGHQLGLDLEKTNVNGGAIALGHPIGASGARILVSLLHALRARDKETGLATLCVGGGQGVALIVERCD